MRLTERDRELIAYLTEPAPVGAKAGINRYLFDLYNRRRDLQAEFPDLERDAGAFIEWVHAHGREEVPIVDELLPPPPREFRRFMPGSATPASRVAPWWGVNVVGYLQAEVGIGEAGRLIISGLDAHGVPVLPVEGAIRPDCRHDHEYQAVPPAAALFPINLLCSSPESLSPLVREVGREFFADRFSIGYWWWETNGLLPFEWRTDFELLDEVWVASHYVADCLSPQLSMPVLPMKLPVEVPDPPPIPREQLGLPQGFLFLFIFDYGSTLKRKNPFATVEAFCRSFRPGEGAALVIKCVNPQFDPEGHARLRALAGGHPDIRVIDQYVSSEEKNAMIAASDCYVSLHHAEGFGLTAAEAMYLGKPVIATGYSGNLDFMTADNSHLIAYTMTEVGEGAWPYPHNGVWADPEIEAAAEVMRRVFDDRDAARGLGALAAQDIRRTHSPRAAGEAMQQRLAEIATQLEAGAAAAASALSDPPPTAGLLARGPMPPPRSTLGPFGRPARRLLLRALRPYTAYQRQIDEQLVASARRAEHAATEAARALKRVRELELKLAQTRAAELLARRTAAAALRGRGAPGVPALANGGTPAGDDEAARDAPGARCTST